MTYDNRLYFEPLGNNCRVHLVKFSREKKNGNDTFRGSFHLCRVEVNGCLLTLVNKKSILTF